MRLTTTASLLTAPDRSAQSVAAIGAIKMTDDGFTRSLESIDRELHEQVERKDKGLEEILHGIFLTQRADLAINRLIDERLKVTGSDTHAVV